MSDDTPDTVPVDMSSLEEDRVSSLESYEILDSAPEEAFDRITSLVTRIFDVPVAMINFIDDQRQWTKSCVGLSLGEIDREISFCTYTVQQHKTMVVLDTLEDPRFAENVFVADDPGIRFYAGAPLVTPDGHKIGAICIVDYEPRESFDEHDQAILRDMASLVIDELELRRESRERKREADRRREMTVQLERNAERLQTALTAATMAVWEWETETDSVHIISDLSEEYGFTAGEMDMPLDRLLSVIVDEDRDTTTRHFYRARTEPVIPAIRFRIEQPSDDVVWLEVVGRRRSPDSSVFVGAVRDVTVEQTQFKTLQESEANLRRVLDRIPLAVTAIHGTQIIYANTATEEVLGIQRSDLPYEAEKLVHPDSRERVFERLALATARSDNEPLDIIENKAVRPDGEIRHVKSTAFTATMMDKEVIISVMRDITEEKQLLARMMQMDRVAAIGTLSSGVGHEINNPLSYIRGNLDYCIRWLQNLLDSGNVEASSAIEVDEARDVLEALQEAREGTERIGEITRDLRRLAKQPDEQFAIFPTSVNSVLNSAVKLAYHEIKGEARLVEELDEIPDALAEPSSLGQVFLNVLLNAARAFDSVQDDRDKIVRVATEVRDDTIVVEIEDNGCGIPQDKLDNVFDPFYTTRSTGEGTGLGLTTAQSSIEKMDGQIEVESTEGEGTLVRICIPKAPSDPGFDIQAFETEPIDGE